MHRLDQNDRPKVAFTFEGHAFTARQGDSVAAALLGAGLRTFRQTAVSGSARGPFCMMGVCFDCYVDIDGVANVQACMTEIRDGMNIRQQMGAKDILPREVGDRATT